MTAIATLYKWFSDLKKPNGAQFKALIDSFWHKSEQISMSSIDGLDRIIEGTASAQQLQNHLSDTNAHKEVLDKKVDKVPGKKLTTEDFTTELRQKLEGLQQVDTSGLLPKGSYTGTAQDLKNLIDNINRILQSDDTDLDQLQEIVTYIKQNKHILSTLGINNIAGLVEALAAKADKDHHHDERYAPITHHHNEYAHRTHRHNWDDIDGKPNNLATTENVKTAIDGIQIGGRNLVRGSMNFEMLELPFYIQPNFGGNAGVVTETFRGNKIIKLIYNWQGFQCRTTFEDLPMIISFWVKTSKPNIQFLCVTDNTVEYVNGKNVISDGKWHKYSIRKDSNIVTANSLKKGFVEFNCTTKGKHIEEVYVSSFKIEYGNTPTDWTPAPEDLATAEELIRKITRAGYEVGADTVIPQAQQNDTVFVKASCTLGLQNIEHLGNTSFRKVFDGGSIIFTCAGKNIIYTGDNTFNGKKGSTAVVSIYNNDCYIDIRNI